MVDAACETLICIGSRHGEAVVIPDVIVVRTFTDGIDEITKVDQEWRFGLDLPDLRWPA